MSGSLAGLAGILSTGAAGGGGGGPVRDPTSGDYYDASNRVTYVTNSTNPLAPTTQATFRWGGVDVGGTGVIGYPSIAAKQITVGAYTYYAGAIQSSSGGNPNTDLYGIYRTTP